MTDKELQDFTKCMEGNAWYNAVQTLGRQSVYSLLAEVYLMRAYALSASRGY